MLMLACLHKKNDEESKQMFKEIVEVIEPHFEWVTFYPMPGKSPDHMIHKAEVDPNLVAPSSLSRFRKKYNNKDYIKSRRDR